MTDTADTSSADTGAPAASPVPTAPAPAAPPAAAEPSAPAAGGTDDPFAELPDYPVFDKGHVESLRREGAKYRTERNELAARYDGLDPFVDAIRAAPEADRGAWVDLINRMNTDQLGAADLFIQIAENIRRDHGQTAPPAAEPPAMPVDDTGAPVAPEQMTPDQMRDFMRAELDRRQAETDRKARVNAIFDTMKQAGYEARSAQGQAILWIANNDTNGDIEAAIAKYQSTIEQGAVDSYVEGKAGQPHATPAPDAGAPATGTTEAPKTFDDAKKRMDAWLRQQRTPGDL